MAETQSMPHGTMLKFFAVVLLVPVVLAVGAVAVSSGFDQIRPSSDAERRQGSRTRKPQCEPLQKACQDLQHWSDCARKCLGDILDSVNTARMQLDAESAARSATPELFAIFQPQYLAARQSLDAFVTAVIEAQGRVATALAEAAGDCALLPGPADPAACQAAARRVEQTLKEARDRLERDLDVRVTVLRAQNATWTSILQFSAQMELHRAALQQCQ